MHEESDSLTMKKNASNPFADLTYADFQRMAQDASLSPQEKIGFPDSYRKDYEKSIYADICSKLPNLNQQGVKVLDIGPGCAGLPKLLIDDCVTRNQELVLVDSAEMLAFLPDGTGVVKIEGFYPDCYTKLESWANKFNVILCYSVFHYIFVEAQFWRFIDRSIALLAPGGQMLIGDIPNVSKRKRFFSSESGIRYHQDFMKTSSKPEVDFCAVENDKIDDAVILGVIMRARAQGCDAYWLSQSPDLPMANRREDILITKP